MKDNEGIFPLYIGLALDSLAWSILWIFTPLHVFLLGGSLFIIGVICALPPFASVVTTPIWGHLSDKTGVRKPFIILGTATSGLLALLYAILTEPFHFLVLTLAIIPFNVAYFPATYALLTERVEMRGESLGKCEAYTSAGWLIGSLVGGLCAESMNLQAIFIIASASATLGTLIILFGLEEHPKKRKHKNTENMTFKEILTRPQMKTLFALLLIIYTGTASFSTFFSIYFTETIGGNYALLGISNALATLFGSIVSVPLGKAADKIGRKPIILYSTLGYVILFILLIIVRDPYAVALLWTIPFYVGIYVGFGAMVSDITSEEERARGMSILSISVSIGSGLGAIIGGALGQNFGIDKNLYFATLLSLSAFLLCTTILEETLKTRAAS